MSVGQIVKKSSAQANWRADAVLSALAHLSNQEIAGRSLEGLGLSH